MKTRSSSLRLFKCILLILSVLLVSKVNAQEISVSSFQLLENDLTANTYGTLQKDYNGEVSALIKIPTTIQGFTFDGGMVGIVKTVQRNGEIWVYVPHGIKKLSIFHQQLGHLRDYQIPVTIEMARTYEMKLHVGTVETVTNVNLQKQFVIFNVNPTNAMVELDGVIMPVDEQGMVAKSVTLGTHEYRVSCGNYHTKSGVINVTAEEKSVLEIKLNPNFGWIDLRATSEDSRGAFVYLDNERIGQLPMKTDALKSGDYSLRFVKSLYESFEQTVSVVDNSVTNVDVELRPNYARVTFLVDDQSEIWLDDVYKGVGQCQVILELGQYKIETRKASHKSTSQLVEISSTEPQQIELDSPVPLYGTIEVMTSPMGAILYIDNEIIGETPMVFNKVLEGKHEVRLEKEGYITSKQILDVVHTKTTDLSITLQKDNDAKVSRVATSPDREPVVINRKVNAFHKDFSFYAGVGAEFFQDKLVSLRTGLCVKGIDIEYNYNTSEGFYTQSYDMRLGYRIGLGKFFLLTPQLGYKANCGWENYADGGSKYHVLDKYSIVACDIQYCLNKHLAISVNPSYSIDAACFSLNAGLVFNIPLSK